MNGGIRVHRVVATTKKAIEPDYRAAPWVNLSHRALLPIGSHERVVYLYSMAIESGTDFNFDADQGQSMLLKKLNSMPGKVSAAMQEFKKGQDEPNGENEKVVLFTGHMIDAEDRKAPRFPPDREGEVRQKIKNCIEEILKTLPSVQNCIGIAGGACGGDILFHEVCKELGVKTKMYLALPPDQYIVESVQFAGQTWVDRFYDLYGKADPEVIIWAETKELPIGPHGQKGYTFWERHNLWLLNAALSHGGRDLAFIAVSDGKGEDGPGGTKHMIEEVRKRGAECIVIRP